MELIPTCESGKLRGGRGMSRSSGGSTPTECVLLLRGAVWFPTATGIALTHGGGMWNANNENGMRIGDIASEVWSGGLDVENSCESQARNASRDAARCTI